MSHADLPRLSRATLDRLPHDIARPHYDRDAQRSGIVHFGIGAFHRAHQAAYTDDAMNAGDRDWGITGVSLRSPAVRDQLAPQAGLYSIVQRDAAGDAVRIAGSVRDVLVGPEQGDAVIDALASADTRIVSFTITEKGYHRALSGGLDLSDPAIAADLVEGRRPATIYGFLRAGLARRRSAGLPGLTLLSCDNLASNGLVLDQCLRAFLDAADPSLAFWAADECACPSTMVDRIVPATTDADIAALTRQIGAHDAAAVVTEPFCQWVIEDRFATARPRWENGGATFVSDVHAHELTKLRLLNGAHSALAYIGLRAGHRFVHEAIADPAIRGTVDRLMREAAATLPPVRDLDIPAYCDQLIRRFTNPRLPHSLTQIAMDGSQKLPQRWLATLSDAGRAGSPCPALLEALAAWIEYVRGDRFEVSDPQADQFRELWETHGADGIVTALFGSDGLFATSWRADRESADTLQRALTQPG